MLNSGDNATMNWLRNIAKMIHKIKHWLWEEILPVIEIFRNCFNTQIEGHLELIQVALLLWLSQDSGLAAFKLLFQNFFVKLDNI